MKKNQVINETLPFKVNKIVKLDYNGIIVYFNSDDYMDEVNLPYNLNVIISKKYEKSYLTDYDKKKCSVIYDFIFQNYPEWLI